MASAISKEVVYIRLIDLSIILLLIISVASGYVSTSNSYYTEGGGVIEDMSLSNMAYTNQVSIYQASLFANADAVLADNLQNCSFENHILTNGEQGAFGADIEARSDKQFSYHRSLAAGAQVNDQTAVSYTLQSGQTNEHYFTDGGCSSVFEDVSVKNVKYVNGAKIYPSYLTGSGNADLVDGVGLLGDRIFVNSNDVGFGTKFFAAAQGQLNYEKSFKTGNIDDVKADVSYNFESGIARVNYFNPSINVDELILTDDSMYKGHVQNTADELNSNGVGRVTKDTSSMFMHDIQMTYGGKTSNIAAILSTDDKKYGGGTDVPVLYAWTAIVDSDTNRAKDIIYTTAYNGDRNVVMEMAGKASGLTDKYAGPLYLSPIGFIGISKELYMSYEITR